MISAPYQSPVIQNGDFVLGVNGDLLTKPDVVTQMSATLTAYHCIYNPAIASGVFVYLDSIIADPNRTALTNIVKDAYAGIIREKVISNLTVAVSPITLNYVNIKITATDAQGNPVKLNWNNVQ